MAAVVYIAWAFAVVVLGAMALLFGLAYLKRDAAWAAVIQHDMKTLQAATLQSLSEMRNELRAQLAELEERDKLWVKEFEGHIEFVAKRCERVESHTKANDTTFMPLGKAYSTRL